MAEKIPPQNETTIMKTMNQLVFAAAVAAGLGLATATAGESRSATVQYGQGGAVTFFKLSVKQTAPEYRAAKQDQTNLRWAQQSVPNGPAISYRIGEPQRFEIAPQK